MDTNNINNNKKKLQQRLDSVNIKLRKYINKTRLSDQKVYEYSLEAEYLAGLLNVVDKIQTND